MKAKIYKFSVENLIFYMKLKVGQQTFKRPLIALPSFPFYLLSPPPNLQINRAIFLQQPNSVVLASIWVLESLELCLSKCPISDS